ncbi:MAG: hypothetical protein IJ620_02460, partial [Bacteroidales bacterium]|nr:hypothetical protein [Bacteroidales bacterium]
LLQVEVGRGTRNPSYGLFADIPWGDYTDIELKAEADLAGGTAYSLSATQPLQAVPYAFLSAESQGLGNAASLGNHAGGLQLKSVKDPTDDQDVVTKRYFDSVMAELVRRNNTLTRDTAACVLPASLPFAWRGHSCSASGVYTHRLAGVGPGGVDSVIILTLTASNGTYNSETVSQSGAYTWHGTPYAASGTYTYAYTDASGCPSVDTLHLTITASVLYGDTTAAECGSFNWYGTPYLASGNYTHTFVGGGTGGLDSILTLHLTVKPFGSKTITETHCDTYHWDLESADYTSSGTYNHVIAGGSANGCDSTVNLDLTINQSVTRDSNANECEHFEWYGIDYTTSGPQTKTFAAAAANGCDSTVRLALTIRAKATFTDTRSACDSYTWIDGNTYTADNNSATYTFTGGAANGCDSTVTLNLTIHHATVGTDTRTECDSYTWIDGNTYTVSNNTAEFHTTNVAGCDSAVTLNLTIHQSSTATDQQVACDSYTWIDGNTYNASTTTPTHTLTNAAGCDSTVTLHLTINASSTNAEIVNVCGSIATYNGITYNATSSGSVYTINSINASGCPLTTTLTVYNRAYTGGGLIYDTVCAGTNTYQYYDTILKQFFEDATYSVDGAWPTTSYNPTWSRTSSLTYVSAINGKFLGRNSTGSNTIQYALSPTFVVSDPTNTFIEFDYILPQTNGADAVVVWYTTGAQNVSNSGDHALVSTGDNLTTWQHYSNNVGATSAGTYHLKFLHGDFGGRGFAFDNVVVKHVNTIDLSGIPNGSNWTSDVTTNAYGCPVSGRYIHKRSTGVTYTEVACNSYTWTNGSTYTESTTTPTRTYNRTYNGHTCSVTDHLNLTISNPASTAVTRSATNNYTWATSGADGHGTGLTYTYSGDYIGPYYSTGACQSRDTLHFTIIPDECSGNRYNVSACETFNWATSGVHGTGDGLAHTLSGTYYGTGHTPAGCGSEVVDTLVLTIFYDQSSSDTRTIQHTELPYLWNGQTFTEASVQDATIPTANGVCDSTITMTLNVEQRSTVDLCYYPSRSGTYWDTLFYTNFDAGKNESSEGSSWTGNWMLSTTDYITNYVHNYGPEPSVESSVTLSNTGETITAYDGKSAFLWSKQYRTNEYHYGAKSRFISPIIAIGDLSKTEVSFVFNVFESSVGCDELNVYWRSPDLEDQYDYIGQDESSEGWESFQGIITDWLPDYVSMSNCSSYRLEFEETDYWGAIGLDNICVREQKTYAAPASYPDIMLGQPVGSSREISSVTNNPDGSKLTEIVTYRIVYCSDCD